MSATAAKRDQDGFVGLTSGKALSILLGFVSLLACGFLFLVVHVWDGIADDIKDLRATSHSDLMAMQATIATQSEAAGEFKAFVHNQLPELGRQIADNGSAVAKLNASVEETRRQVAALTQTVEKLRDSVILKKTDFTVEQFDFDKDHPSMVMVPKSPWKYDYSVCSDPNGKFRWCHPPKANAE